MKYKIFCINVALCTWILGIGTLTGCSEPGKRINDTQTGRESVVPQTQESRTNSPESEKEMKETQTPPAREPSFAGELSLSEGLDQLIIVEAETNDSSSVVVTMHERQDGVWTEILCTDGYAGYGGIAKEKEGDGRTPTGVYGLSVAFGTKPDPGSLLPYTRVDDSYWWVGDYESSCFNQLCREDMPDRDWEPDPVESEHLVDCSGYEYCLFIEYNTEGAVGKGSCIFLHCIGEDPPTLGCVAVPEEDMVFILRHIQEGCRILIDTTENLPGY